MQLLALLATTASLLTSSVLSAPAPAPFASPSDASVAAAAAPTYWFNVTKWTAGCARSGCSYSFNVAAPADGQTPAFKAYCSGYDVGYMQECQLLKGGNGKNIFVQVASALNHTDFSQPIDGAHMSVSMQWSDTTGQGSTYNATGHHLAKYNQFSSPPQHFKVIPTELWAIA